MPFPKYVCPLPKDEFLENAVAVEFNVDAKPRNFKGRNFGWTWSAHPSIEVGDEKVRTNTGCNFIVQSNFGKLPMTAKQFMKHTKGMNIKMKITAEPDEFSTGRFGWRHHDTIMRTVGGKELRLRYNLNSVVPGSGGGKDPVIPKPIPEDIFEVIGEATEKEKDDLTKIKGIGPWIEKRLNRIGIYTFKQISKMTPTIEEDIVKAIVYFPGRQRRDNWVEQASELAKKVDKNPGKPLRDLRSKASSRELTAAMKVKKTVTKKRT